MSPSEDVDVAGVRVRARHVPALVERLRRRNEPVVAYKVQRVLDARTLRVTFGHHEREVILRAIADKPPEFSDLYDELLQQLKARRGRGG